jgi:uncharacterized protein involved in exopolysaccharide biosynthesis
MAMTTSRLLHTVRARKWLLVLPVVIIGGGTVVASSLRPEKYQSEAQLTVTQSRVPNAYASPAHSEVGEWADDLRDRVLSRTQLERIITELNLYETDRQAGIAAAIDRMRRDIHVRVERQGRPVVALGFTASNPVVARRVAEKVTSVWIDAAMSSRERAVAGISKFLENRIADVRQRLERAGDERRRSAGASSRVATLEYEALEQSYRDLLLQREELDAAVALERTQMGSQIELIEPPRLPHDPVGPSRMLVNLTGAVAGLAVGLILVAVSPARRSPDEMEPIRIE